jgi:hypothetical protein
MAYYKEQREYSKRQYTYKVGVIFGSKRSSYYKNEMDYGTKNISYSLDTLSNSEKEIIKTMRGIFEGKLTKKDGKVIYKSTNTKSKYKNFINDLKEGQVINVYMEATNGDGTLAQLAKVHKCIRVLASDLGYSFEDVKLLVKDKAGLVIKRNVNNKTYNDWKSFADCSLEELNLAIQASIELGDFVGSNLR